MSDHAVTVLSVSVRDLPTVHVANIEYKPGAEPGDMHAQIGDCFRRVQAWVREHGYDPLSGLTIGAIKMAGDQLSSYECCIQVPEQVQGDSGKVGTQDLVGGRYAVVSIVKDPSVIGDSINRFYREYAPQNNIEIDGARPTYEVYYESTIEYCVPIV